jgi:hypothetical protein
MAEIDKVSKLVQGLITAGTVWVVVRSSISIGLNGDENGSMKRRIRNALVFLVIATMVFIIKDVLLKYYE